MLRVLFFSLIAGVLIVGGIFAGLAAYNSYAMSSQQITQGSHNNGKPQTHSNNGQAGAVSDSATEDTGGGQHTEKANQRPIGPVWDWLDARQGALTAISTVFLMLLTGALVAATIGLYLTGEKSAQAAKSAADTAHEALVKSQRAFVVVSGFPWLWRPDNSRPQKIFYEITPIIENKGDTPTTDMMVIRDFVLRDTKLPDDFNFPYRDHPGPALIGPHQTIGAATVNITDEDLLAVQEGKKFLYIWGTITYRDIFDGTPDHITDWATEITRVNGNPLDPRDIKDPKAATVEIYFGILQTHNRTN